jgi:type I restriction enzyme S subunit
LWTVDTIFWTESDLSVIRPRFLFHYLKTQDLTSLNNAGGVPSLTQAILNPIPIPVPALGEQDRIVEILDKFDALVNDLSDGLPAELAARRKQYKYYRDKLLTFEEAPA